MRGNDYPEANNHLVSEMNFKGSFTIVDASDTHSQLLLRHSYYDSEGAHNMDIIFYGVRQLSIPFTLIDPIIDRRQISENDPNGLEFLFDIRTLDGKFSIVAFGCRFQRNQLNSTKGLAHKHNDPLTIERIQEIVEKFDLKAWLESNRLKKWTDVI